MATTVAILADKYIQVPTGNGTTDRPGSPAIGMLRYNTSIGSLEQYTANGWVGITAPPTITSISPTSFNGNSGSVITVNGSNFDASSVVKFIDVNNNTSTSLGFTFVNTSTVTATTPSNYTVAQGPVSVQVINGSGQAATLNACLATGSAPSWTTSSGTIFDGADDTSGTWATVAGTDADSGATISYSVSSGALPTGLSLGSSNGNITGTTSSAVSSATTTTFTLGVSDGINTTTRSFSMVLRPSKLTTASSFPTSGSNYSVYTTAWTGSATDLNNLSHAASTFRVPSNVYEIRVMVWGGGAPNMGGGGGAAGGYASALYRVTPQEYYKVIVGGGGVAYTQTYGGKGSEGLGGGGNQDGNDQGCGGAGSGFFYAANTGGTLNSTDSTMFSKAVLIAGGGGNGTGTTVGGGGNSGGSQTSLTVAGQSGYGIAGGAGNSGSSGLGGKYDGQGGNFRDQNGAQNATGGAVGYGGTYSADGFGGSYGGGSGGGRGGGGCGGGSASYTSGENATGDGGRGSGNYTSGLYNNSGPGLGGKYGDSGSNASIAGNGFRFQGINLGGGGSCGHGSSQAAGGWGGGASGRWDQGGGGGSGCAFGNFVATPTLSGWVNTNSVSITGGNVNSVLGVSTAVGTQSNGNGTVNTSAVVIVW